MAPGMKVAAVVTTVGFRSGVHCESLSDIVRVVIVIVTVVRANQLPQSFFRESRPRQAGAKLPTRPLLPGESQ